MNHHYSPRPGWKTLLGCGAGVLLAAVLVCSRAQAAADYPNKPITVINPWTPGGPADLVVRPIVQKLSERLGQSIIIENRAGANGVIGATFVARAKPDGYTLLFSHVGPITISPYVQKDIPYDPVKDFAPITQVVSAPTVLVVRPALPIKNLQDVIAYAKEHPGKLSYGSVGPGSTTHLAGEMLAMKGGVKLLHVPYKGAAPVITDLLGSQIDMAFINISGALPYIQSGQLRPIAVSTLKRSSLLPDLPTVAETYPGYEVNSWYGFMAPARTPKAIVDELQKDIAEIIKTPEIAKLLKSNGLEPEGSTPDQYAAKIKDDMQRWATVVKAIGLTPQ